MKKNERMKEWKNEEELNNFFDFFFKKKKKKLPAGASYWAASLLPLVVTEIAAEKCDSFGSFGSVGSWLLFASLFEGYKQIIIGNKELVFFLKKMF